METPIFGMDGSNDHDIDEITHHPPSKSMGDEHTDATLSSEQVSEKRKAFRIQSEALSTTSKKVRRYWKRLGPWTWEIIALTTSFSLFSAVFIVLAVYDRQNADHWRHGISLNAIASILSTIGTFTLMVPVASAMGQLKWARLRHQARPLSEFQRLDGASRGPWGCILLLWKRQRGIIATVGAILTVIVLAISPFVQQLVGSETRQTVSESASIPIARTYILNAENDFTSNLFVKAAVYDGFIRSPAAPMNFPVTPYCPTSNCNWSSYLTLGVCSTCQNITNLLKLGYVNPADMVNSPSNYSLPNGHFLGQPAVNAHPSPSSRCIMNITNTWALRANAPDNITSDNWSLVYSDRGSLIIDLFAIVLNGVRPFAAECILQYCVEEFTADVRNGTFVESTHSTWTNNSAAARDYAINTYGNGRSIQYIFTPPNQNATFTVGNPAQVQLSSWLVPILHGQTYVEATSLLQDYTNDIIQSIYVALTTTDATLYDLMNNVASSLTTAIRVADNSSFTVGMAYQAESYIHIRWAWIALPVTLVFCTLGFLITVSLVCKREDVEVWKNSSAAVLFHGLDDEGRRGLGMLNRDAAMDDAAESLIVKMELSGEGWRLVPTGSTQE